MGWPLLPQGFITPLASGFILTGLLAWRQEKCLRLQRALEVELDKSRDQLKDIADFARVALFQTKPDGTFRAIDARTAEMIGYSEEDLLSGRVTMLDLYADMEDRDRLLAGLREQGGVLDYPLHLRRRDGSDLWLAVTVIRREDDDGLYFDGIGIDVTERREMERQRFQEEEKFRNFFENAGEGILFSDVDTRIIEANAAAAQILGYDSPQELAGLLGLEIVHPEDQAAHSVERNLRQTQEGMQVHMERRYRKVDGSYVPVDVTIKGMGDTGMHHVIFRDITERRLAEEALARSRTEVEEHKARLTMAMGMAKIAPWEMDVATETFTFYDDFYSLYATSAEREGGPYMPAATYAREFVHPDDAWVVANEMEVFRASEDSDFSTAVEHRIIRRDGEVRYITVQYCLFRDEQGRPLKTVGVNQDITERKRAEEALRKSEQGYRQLFDNTPVGIFVTDSQGQALRANPEMARILGAESTQDALERYRDLASTLYVDPTRRTEFLRALKRDGEVHSFEYEANTLDGRRVWLSMNARIRETHGDGSFEIDGFTWDITERKRAEQAVQASEQRFRLLLEDVDMVAVQGYDQDRRIIYWNKASERLYGYAAEEVMGRRLEETIIPEAKREPVVQGVNRWIEHGEPVPAGEMELRRKDGTLVPVYSSHAMQVTASGAKEMYCVDVDLSDIKQAHNQLLRAKELAEAASRAKSEFLANMSHEIRTPLNGILGMLQLLELSDLDQEQAESANAAIQSTKRLNRLLSDILDISRVEAGKLVIQSLPFRLEEAVHQVCELFEPAALRSEVKLECELEPGLPKVLRGDSARLQQVLGNLLGNAFKFTDHGSIRLEVQSVNTPHPRNRRILFQVSDTGIGISRDQLGKLFQAFTQVDEGMSRKYQGAGLGLTICRQLVEHMGGTIGVDSEPGQGALFYFCLPFELVEEAEEEPRQLSRTLETSVKKLLLAEDDRVNQLSVIRLLAKHGVEVTAVSNGEEALAALAGSRYDAVLMDIQMPVIDGLKATRAIRDGIAGDANRNIPIVALTAYAMSGDREKFLQAGMNGYLSKPVELNRLLQVLSEVTLPD